MFVPLAKNEPDIVVLDMPWSIFVLITSTSLTNTFNVPLPKFGELKSKSNIKSSPEPTIIVSGIDVEI